MSRLEDARAAYNAAVTRMTELADEIEALADDASDEVISEKEQAFADQKTEVERCAGNFAKTKEIAEARANHPILETPEPPVSGDDPERRFATAKGELKEESTYRPDGAASFFRDIAYAAKDPPRRCGSASIRPKPAT
jgi:hypothetical protein